MKKIILVLCLCLIFISGAQAATTAEINLSQPLRVGLKELYEMKDSILINNSSLILGYQINGTWTQEYELICSTGYTITPAPNFFLISNQTFNNYLDSANKANLLKEQGYNAYGGSASPGVWKVYVGSLPTEADANTLKSTLQNVFDLTYEVVGDNGLRTLLTYASGNPIIMENSYAQATFGTNDLLKGVNVISLGKRSYRGKMEIGRYNKKGVTAINVVNLEEYLYGVVPAEMITSWPLEALKAQAVAARNFAVYYGITGKKYSKEPYTMCDTVSTQVYKGFGSETTTCNQAVNETYGKLVYLGDMVIPTYYFSTSGGHTEDSENVWSGSLAYAKGVSDIYESEPEKQPWLLSFTSNDIEAILAKNNLNIGSVTDIVVTSYSDAGRAMSLKIIGTTGSTEVSKETMRTSAWLGLYSRKFTIVKSSFVPQENFSTLGSSGTTGTINYKQAYAINGSNSKTLIPSSNQLIVFSSQNIYDLPTISGKTDTYIFVGEGSGHGVGMSQSGAKGMALAGYTYKQILEYYYTGVVVK